MQATRGYGVLENWLARQRASVAQGLLANQRDKIRILDIGCGTTPIFLQQCGFKECYGIDAEGREGINIGNINIKRQVMGEGKGLLFRDDFFDAVTMLAVWEHISPQELRPLTLEVYRVLRKDGSFVVTTPSPLAGPLLTLLGWLRLVSREELREHKQLSAHRVVKSVLSGAGFAADSMQSGFLELGFNQWVYAKK